MFVNEVTSVVSFITWEPQVLGIDFQSRVPWLQPLINLQNRCFWLVLILFWFDCRACFFGVFSLLLIFESLSGYFRLFLVFPSLSLHALHVSVSFFFLCFWGPYCVPRILLEGSRFLLGFAILLSYPGPIVPTEKWYFEQVKLMIYAQYLSITRKVYKINDCM